MNLETGSPTCGNCPLDALRARFCCARQRIRFSKASPTRLRSVGLKTKTLIIIGVLMSIIIGVADQLELGRNHAQRTALLEARASLAAQIQADACDRPMWDLANEQVKQLLGALARDSDFLSAELIGADGKRVAAHGNLDASGGYIEAKADVKHGEGAKQKTIGRLLLRLSTGSLEAALQKQFEHGIYKLVIILGMLMMAIWAALMLISRPLDQMTQVMGRLAEGSTEVEIPALDRRNEIGAMARAVSVFKSNAMDRVRLEAQQVILKEQAEEQRRNSLNDLATMLEGAVNGVVQTVSSACEELERTATSMTSGAEKAGEQVGLISSASEGASENVQMVANSAEELSRSIGEISRQTSQSAEVAGQAATETNETGAAVRSLAETAQKIGDVVKLIHDIAAQTNLLAQCDHRSGSRGRRRPGVRGRRIGSKIARDPDGKGYGRDNLPGFGNSGRYRACGKLDRRDQPDHRQDQRHHNEHRSLGGTTE